MTKLRKSIYITLLTITALVVIIAGFIIYLYFSSEIMPPVITEPEEFQLKKNDSITYYGPNKLKQNKFGFYEIYIEGNDVNRGNAYGKLLDDLLYKQEEVFINKMYDFIPNESYMKFLRIILRIAMRGVTNYIPQEYCREIFAMSKYCTNEFNWLGLPYERQINYHAAHDIGHAMQDYMLVGCSSFGCWDSFSRDSNLIIGRNFDFYINDEFAQNKLITFCNPDSGHRFISVSWPGMIGVVSAMNSKGITVTINAAQGKIPIKTATPITILAREIIQYADNINEAIDIAKKHKTFVSESILVGSGSENKAVIIEKTPEFTTLYESDKDYILCTNHYQSDSLKYNKINIDNIKNSDSKIRYDQLKYLVNSLHPIDQFNAAKILRNPYENNNDTLKLCSECAINQFIAHHSVIFKPKELKMWVSTSPWQLGEYICYDMSDSIDFSYTIYKPNLTISADSIIYSDTYEKINYYRKTKDRIMNAVRYDQNIYKETIDSFICSNPNYFQTYQVIGDYYKQKGNLDLSEYYWRKALSKNPRKLSDKSNLLNKLK